MNIALDVLPGRCEIRVEFAHGLLAVTARNLDTEVEGPAVLAVPEGDILTLTWAELDPHGLVAPTTEGG